MRHAFSFPAHIREAVRAHVRQAVADVSPTRFEQEPAYTDYFVRRILTTLDGDTRPAFVGSVQESSLKQLRVLAQVRATT